MLQIKNIRKTYVTGELTQTALDDVSLSFREHELVAILGPSGSGKSTLLNVIGGLDHYDSGDLIINGISTKKYTDRDWDSYRNHSVGFIFQSYNLIPHQNVLSNVELALTISGIPASERKRRAIEALKNVGLANQLHKKPNQMSGGQMQRVAIARALVNNPKILLADEPTGALDSETSVQVMELLKEVAKDRLVVMVTHNPELAQQYATRIVRVKDGRILDDTDPYTPDLSAQEPPKHKNMGRSSMSFHSALVLSFQNLWTKKARTLLTSFAGSIGIIGIALILSLSAGFQAYVDSIQKDTMANYPLTFQAETADMSAAFMSMMMPDENPGEETPGTVLESQMLARMFAHIGVNDLKSFKAHIEDHQDQVDQMVTSIQYGYGIRPRIYTDNPEDPFQVNPATLFKEITGNDGISAMMDVDAFQQLSDDQEMLDAQYEVVTGRWPEAFDEMVFVLPPGGRIADQTAYTLGLKSMDHMDHMLDLMERGLSPITDDPPMEWTYEDLMGLTFRFVPTPDFYRYNEEFEVWEDLSQDPDFLSKAVADGLQLHVVGIVSPREPSSAILMPGLGYTRALTEYIIADAAESRIVKAQLADENTDVFSGIPFDSDDFEKAPDLGSLFSVDPDAIANSFGVSITEQDFANLLQTAMDNLRSAVQVDTTQAQAEFTSVLYDLGYHMLSDAVEAGSGTASFSLADADSMVRNFLAGSYAHDRLSNLSDKYKLTQDVFYNVYQPLLVGMVSQIIADQTPPMEDYFSYGLSADPQPIMADPLHSLRGHPQAVLLSDIQHVSPVPPEEIPAPENAVTPEEVTPQLPVDTLPSESEPLPQTPAETDPIPQESQPEPELPPETEIPPESEPAFPETEPEQPQEKPDLPVLPEDFTATLTQNMIDPAVAAFCSSDMVRQTGVVVSQKMMEATVLEGIANQVAGLSDVFTTFLRDSFFVDANQLTGAFKMNIDEEKIQRLFEALMNGTQARSARSNLRRLGYADLESPSNMSVYMKDFDGKEDFIHFIEDYNDSMLDADQEGKVIRYTDMTGKMMDSVRIIINSVSYVLIAFVSVSLVVSSIMIGIITYISVMERTREIGVLRAMGASKHNISQVFNAETFIIGLCSGFIGIGVTLLLLIPGNKLLYHLTKNAAITASLPWVGAVILIVLSMLLTLLGGLIPSRQAAKKDPVIALRSE